MIPLPFIEPKAGYPIYRLKLERLQQLLPGASPGLDTICDGILAQRAVRARSDTTPRSRRVRLTSNRHEIASSVLDSPGCCPRRAASASVVLGGASCAAVAPPSARRAAASRSLAQPADADDGRDGHCAGGPCSASRSSLARVGARRDRRRVAAGARSRRSPCSSSASSTTGCSCRRWPSWCRRSPSARSWCSRSQAAEPDAACRGLHTLIATVWFAGVCHAFNLLDNMDGLAAGVALIAARVPGMAAGRRARAGAGRAARRAGRRAARVPLLEPAARAAVHGRLRQSVHRRDARRRVAGAGVPHGVAFVSPVVLVVVDPRRAALRHGVRAGAAAAGRPQARRRAAPITSRTGSCRSVSRSAAPSGSCTCWGCVGGADRVGAGRPAASSR